MEGFTSGPARAATPEPARAATPEPAQAATSEPAQATTSGPTQASTPQPTQQAARGAPPPDDCVDQAAEQSRKPVVDIAVELHDDDNFGPVFRFTAPSVDGVSEPQRVYGLPPLNPMLARDIVSRSRYARLIAPEPALAALTALSQAVCDVKEIVGLTLTLRVFSDHVVVVAPTLHLASHAQPAFAIVALSAPLRRDTRLARDTRNRTANPPGRRSRASRFRRSDDA